MVPTAFSAALLPLVSFVASATRFLPLAFIALVAYRYTRSADILPGVPKLEGLLFLGVLLLSLRYGASEVLVRLLVIATDGISYASVAGNALVFVHDPGMIRQLLTMPEGYVWR
jgi:hypothetical protein